MNDGHITTCVLIFSVGPEIGLKPPLLVIHKTTILSTIDIVRERVQSFKEGQRNKELSKITISIYNLKKFTKREW